MAKMKLLGSVLLVLAVLFMQVGSAAAAPQTQGTTPVTGTVQSITIETDSTGATTVVVTLLDDQGATQTVNLSVDQAVALGLVTLDPNTQQPVVDQTKVGQTVSIGGTEDVHPIAQILGDFFGVDPSVVEGYHDDGFGFGVIAQAMWMSQAITGDASAAGDILQAKKTGDFSAFDLPDGSHPTNWGQFKKALRDKDNKHNLGIIVSGHANDENTDHGKGKDKNKDKDKGKGKDPKNNHP